MWKRGEEGRKSRHMEERRRKIKRSLMNVEER
jgi:hypothetical protein